MTIIKFIVFSTSKACNLSRISAQLSGVARNTLNTKFHFSVLEVLYGFEKRNAKLMVVSVFSKIAILRMSYS